MKKRLLFVVLAVAVGGVMFAPQAVADEGMWLPALIGSRIKDMRSKGFKLKA